MQLKELEYALDNYYNHWALKDSINSLNALKDGYEALYDTGGSINYDGMPHGNMPGNPSLEAVCKIGDKPEEIKKDITEKRKAILNIHRINREIEQALHSLEPPEEEIIHLRHMERMDFKSIGKATHYSESRIKHKYFSAMYKILYLVCEKKVSTK
jgi:RNA polymerase sigma factor (sigma-70 family)